MDKIDMELSEGWDIVSSDCEDVKEKIVSGGDSSSDKLIESNDHAKGARVQDTAEHETAAGNDSSSSDIDIIDENLEDREEIAASCFIPSTVIISSSVEKSTDTCSEESVISSETISLISLDPEDIKDKSEASETSNFCPRNDNADTDQSASTWIIFGKPIYDWIALLLEYLQNLSGFQWSCLFGLSMCLYFCITINQTNIIALHQKGNVASQMEKMIDELRNDNKLLKEQMLSEMKNDKLVSSFEHQIRELKKENSKLNHMLYDVVKVLEKQKDTQEKLLEKKEADYQAPFKNEINKLKEHINMLKFDNEELQKQLVRMRYASYSQGKHTDVKDKKEFGKDKHEKYSQGGMKDEKSHATKKNEDEAKDGKEFCSEAPLDLESLKKWNNLINQVIKELGLFEKYNTEEKVNAESDSKTEKGADWSWKEFKGYINLPNVHVSELVSKYKKSSEKVFSKIYKSASSYFTNAKENAQSFFEASQSKEKNSDKKFKLWNIINDLGETLGQIKKKALDSYQKDKFSFYDYFEESGVHENVHDDPNMQENKGYDDKMDEPDQLYEQKQHENIPDGIEKDKWFFERADLRAKLRKGEDESSINWFLKKKRKDIVIEYSDEEPIDVTTSENEKQEF